MPKQTIQFSIGFVILTLFLVKFSSAGDQRIPRVERAAIQMAAAGIISGETPTLSGSNSTILPDMFTGTLTASISVPVPSGRKGLSPQLALSYKSVQQDTWLGVGWDLDFGAIERSMRHGISYENDEYIFKSSSGISDLLLNDGYYWAKIESEFWRYSLLNTEDGFPYWLAVDKLGTKYFFGQSDSSRIYDPNNSKHISRWNINRIEDTHGNFIQFEYVKPGGVQTYLAKIRYTLHQTLTIKDNEVSFFLEQRPEKDRNSYFSTGFKITNDFRLKSIVITGEGNTFSAYSFVYSQSSISGRSLLTLVQPFGRDAEFAGDGSISGDPLPPYKFTYLEGNNLDSSHQHEWNSVNGAPGSADWVDFNGDGRADYCRLLSAADQTQLSCILSTSTGFGEDIRSKNIDPGYADSRAWVDVNGDGKADFCRIVGNATEFRARCTLSQGTEFGKETVSNPQNERVQVGRAWVDVNGDHKTDYCRAVRDSEKPLTQIRWESDIDWVPQEMMGTGKVICTLASQDGHFGRDIATRNIDLGQRSGWSYTDFNGDHKLDYCRVIHPQSNPFPKQNPANQPKNNEPIYALACTLFSETTFGDDIIDLESGLLPGDSFGRAWVDFNGDGLSDYCRMTESVARCSISDGKQIDHEVRLINTDRGYREGRAWVDFNGDGRADYCRTVGAQKFPRCLVSNGDAFGTEFRWSYFSGDQEWHRAWPDVDGDGAADFCYLTNIQGVQSAHCMRGGIAASDLLESFSNGIGGLTKIEYAPSTIYQNQNLPVILQTVRSVTRFDGRGNKSTFQYSYEGGFWHLAKEEFRGFSHVTETSPAGVNGEQKITQTWFHQGGGVEPTPDDPLADEAFMIGKPYRVLVTDAAERKLSETFTTYVADTTPPYFNPVSYVQTLTCEGNNCDKSVEIHYRYDSYGNLILLQESGGDVHNLSEHRTVVRTYLKNQDAWIVGLLGTEKIYSGSVEHNDEICPEKGQAPSNLAFCVDNFYDGARSCSDQSKNRIPAIGDLTRTLTWLRDGNAIETRIAYGQYGEVNCARDPNGNETVFKYDGTATYSIEATSPKGFSIRTSYYGVDRVPVDHGSYGQVKTITDPNGSEDTREYDTSGRPSRIVSSDGGLTTFAYQEVGNAENQYIEITTNYGDFRRYFIDGQGRSYRSQKNGQDGRVINSDTVFDQRGFPVWQSIPYFEKINSQVWSKSDYDALGRIVRTTSPNGSITKNCYSYWDTISLDELGHKVRTTKDMFGRVVKVSQFVGKSQDCVGVEDEPFAVTRYSYDALGRLVEVSDANENKTMLTYDEIGRRKSLTDPNSGTWTYTYDPAGNLTQQTDASGGSLRLTYDKENRITERTFDANLQKYSMTYEYDANIPFGKTRLHKIIDSYGSEIEFNYDSKGRTASISRKISGKSYQTKYLYDKIGRLVSTETPDGNNIAYLYVDGLLKEVRNNSHIYATYENYNSLGQPNKIKYGNGVVTKRTFCPEANFRLCGLETRSVSQEILQSSSLTYDLSGKVLQINDSLNGYEWFSYDDLGRLILAYGPSGPKSFSYDKVGNLSFASDLGTYIYPASDTNGHSLPNAVSRIGQDTFLYDNTGRELSGPDRTFEYDATERPSKIKVKKTIVKNEYGLQEQRITRTTSNKNWWVVGANKEKTIYVGPEYRCEGDHCVTLINVGGRTIAIDDASSNEIYYLHYDHIGSVRLVTNVAGIVVRKSNFSPFGKKIFGYSSVRSKFIPEVFAGLEIDSRIGLCLVGSRYYDPTLGRFLQTDIGGADSFDPRFLNRYAYALNDPESYVDPSGENPFLIAVAVGAIIGGLYAGAESGWNGESMIRGALIGAVAGGVGGGLSPVIGPALGAAAAGAAGAALSGGDVMQAAVLGMVTYGVSSGITEISHSDALGAAAGGAMEATMTGEDPAKGALFSFLGATIGDGLQSQMKKSQTMTLQIDSSPADQPQMETVKFTPEPVSPELSEKPQLDFAKEWERVTKVDPGIHPDLITPVDFTYFGGRLVYKLGAWLIGGFRWLPNGGFSFRFSNNFRIDWHRLPEGEYPGAGRNLPHYHRRPGIKWHRPWEKW